MFRFERVTRSTPESPMIRQLLLGYAEKAGTSYFTLSQHKCRWYAIYDNGKFCGCSIPVSLGSALYAVCIFCDAHYCAAEPRPAIMQAAVMDYQPKWIDMEYIQLERRKCS